MHSLGLKKFCIYSSRKIMQFQSNRRIAVKHVHLRLAFCSCIFNKPVFYKLFYSALKSSVADACGLLHVFQRIIPKLMNPKEVKYSRQGFIAEYMCQSHD